jgi:hypothetical protein
MASGGDHSKLLEKELVWAKKTAAKTRGFEDRIVLVKKRV